MDWVYSTAPGTHTGHILQQHWQTFCQEMSREGRRKTVKVPMWQWLDRSADIVDVGRSQQYTPMINIIYRHKHGQIYRHSRHLRFISSASYRFTLLCWHQLNISILIIHCSWLGGVMVRASDMRSSGCGFDSRSGRMTASRTQQILYTK